MEITIDDSNSKVGSGIEIILGDDLSVSGNMRESTLLQVMMYSSRPISQKHLQSG